MKESCSSVETHASEVPADFDDPTDSSSSLNQLLVHLPEELILCLLSYLKRRDCLACACVSRALNRIAIPYLLAGCGVKNPAYRCKLVLDPYKTNIDPLLILQHSVFIKKIKYLSFHFTRFYASSKLAPPLLRCLYLLRTLTHVEEVALYLPSTPESAALDSFAEDENHIQEMVLVWESLLNQIVLKSSKTIRVLGLAGLLSHVYNFRKESLCGKSPGGPLKSPARLLAGVKDLFDQRQSKKNPKDPVILDETRYFRPYLKHSRLFLQCSPEALKQTQLTCLRVDSPYFFRPPFSQWVFPMLRASNLHTLSFPFSHRPADTEEVEFILQRLATAIPNVNQLHLHCVKKEVLLILMKWINMFAHLQTLVIEPSFDTSNEQAGLLDTSNSTLPNFNNTQTTPSAPFSFSPHLRHIQAPYQFLTYFASIASSSPSPRPKDGHQSRFPALQIIWLSYDCVRGVKFDSHVLANAFRHIRPVLLPPRLAGGTSDSSNSSSASLIVQIEFDRRFSGLASALTMNYSNTVNAQSKNLDPQPSTIDSTDTNNDPGSDAGDPNNSSTSNNEVDNISADTFELSKIEYLRIHLPGKRKQILQGEFDDQIILALSHFGGLRALRLASEVADGKPSERLSPSHSMVFKEGRPGLTRVEVSGS